MKYTFFIFSIILFSCELFSKQNHGCQMFEKFPAKIEACEGEDCGKLSYGKAIADADLYEEPSLQGKKVGTLKRCDKIEGFTSIVMIEKLGEASVTKTNKAFDTMGIKKEQKLSLMLDHGEGYVSVCVGKKKFVASAVGSSDGDTPHVKVLTWPKSSSWVQLNYKGKKVYAQDRKFYMDRYNEDSELKCKG